MLGDKALGVARNRRPIWGCAALVALALGVATAPAGVQAQGTAPAEAQSFDIPAQPLTDALIQFGRQSGLQASTDPGLARTLRSAPVAGEMTWRQALSALLAGTGLTYSVTGSLVTLERPAAEQDSGPLVLDPLRVEGQRVLRTPFETSSSLTVFTEERIQSLPRAREVDDLLERTPNITQNGIADTGMVIRGVNSTGPLRGATQAIGGSRPRATTVVDGRPLIFEAFGLGGTSIYDIDQVEIFSGPQTTVQGVNSIAGAIFVQTRDPTFTPDYGVEAEVDTSGGRRLAGYASGPIIDDQLAFRFTADGVRDDVDVDFGQSIASDSIFSDPERLDQLLLRGKLLFEPEALPGLSTQLTVSYSDVRRPTNELARQPFGDRIARDFTIPPRADVETLSGVFDLSYDFGQGVEISNRLSYTDFESSLRVPSRPAPTFLTTSTDGYQLTNETLLRFDRPDARLSGLTGLFVSRKEQDDFPVVFGPQSAIADEQTSLGAFTELTYSVTDRLDITGGLRYQRDSQRRVGQTGFASLSVDFDESFDAVLPKADISYGVTDTTRVGVTASRGFNPGGVTLNFNTFGTSRFDEETVWNYELYARTRLLDDRLYLAANLFYSEFDGFQNSVVDGFTPTGDPQFVIGNADEATTRGFELIADFEATDWLTLFGSLGLLDTEFERETAPGVSESFEFGQSPDVMGFIGADIRPFPGWTLSGQLRHTGGFFSDDENVGANAVDSVTVLDLSTRYDFANGATVTAFVSNVFDSDAVTYRQNAGQEATLLDELTVGVGVSFRF